MSAPNRPRLDLQIDSVTVRFGHLVALDAVSLAVPAGRFVAVTGPSGAGKSTLLWTVAGAVRPASGRVLVGGQLVTGRAQTAAAGVAVIPQGGGLSAVLTARENVLLPALAGGARSSDAQAATLRALESVGLGESTNHMVEELSGGQQQRVAVARALALDPVVLLADEPTSELDHGNREIVLALLRERADRGVTVLMATHDPEAAAAADLHLTLDDGRLGG